MDMDMDMDADADVGAAIFQELTIVYRVEGRLVSVRMSDADELPLEWRCHRKFHSLSEGLDWYKHQKLFAQISGCLQVHFITKDDCRAVFDDFSDSWDDWFGDKAHDLGIDDEDWQHGKAKQEQEQELWFGHIKEEFIDIFRNVTGTLRAIHSSGLYHGNLRDGIVIKNGLSLLYNMRKHSSGRSVKDLQLADYDDLIHIIVYVVTHPSYRRRLARNKEAVEREWSDTGLRMNTGVQEADEMCLKQLKGRLDGTLEPRWATYPALLWDVEEEMAFLQGMYFMLYRRSGAPHVSRFIRNKFSNDWKLRVLSPVLSDVLGTPEEHNVQYPAGMSQIKFWRHAKEHVNTNFIPYKDGEQQSSEELIHNIFIREVITCLPQSVAAMNELAQRSNAETYSKAQMVCNEMKLKYSVDGEALMWKYHGHYPD